MEKKAASFSLSSLFLLCLLIVFPGRTISDDGNNIPTKLFVFGDSYADTGNKPVDGGFACWKEPYGITFPGKPAGRFSDGFVLPDLIAEYLGIKSPVPYTTSKHGLGLQKYGMNFAYGGTGVFDTITVGPNITTQINTFQQLIEQHVFTKHDLRSSIAHVSASGNDYHLVSVDKKDVERVVSQLVLNLRRVYNFGIPRISVVTMAPLGCLPSPSKVCNESENFAPKFHNQLLRKAVEQLNNETGGSTFAILDLYSAFMSVLNVQDNRPGNSSFVNPLEECCKGTTIGSKCGDVDEDGRKEYVVCEDPKLSFFWDPVHPTQQGWLAVFASFKSSLNTLLLPQPQSTSSSAVI